MSSSSSSSRFNAAIEAMKDIGIPPKMAKPVLKNLLKVYDNEWDLIEGESYRTLADAIFEWQEYQEKEKKNVIGDACEREEDYSEYEPPQTRSRLRIEEPHSSPPSVPLLPYHDTPSLSEKPIVEEPSPPLKRRRQLRLKDSPDSLPATLACLSYEEASSSKRPISEIALPSSGAREKGMCGDEVSSSSAIKKPKVEVVEIDQFQISSINDLLNPCTNNPLPSSLGHDDYPSHFSQQTLEAEPFADDYYEVGVDAPLSIVHPSSLEKPDKENFENGPADSQNNEEDGENGRMKKNDILPANSSTPQDRQSSLERALPDVQQHIALNGVERVRKRAKLTRNEEAEVLTFEHNTEIVLGKESHDFFGAKKPLHDVYDISKGEEKVRIPVVNEVNSEPYPPLFHYIPNNLVYQNAYVNFSLARIGDEDCCASCFGNCLLESIPCACARETGGEYAYTLKGLVKKEFLDGAISLNREPEKHKMFYCKDCPLERSKSDGPCKGHLVRRFIKECWSKCGCSKQCGNRVVQRGITTNLQVFLTPEGKGWGLRTLERLPRGAFVCEYVGEIVTNTELFYRNEQRTGHEKHTYPVLLDADWGSEGVLKDEEALCLDATYYGNVARFINHRCYDATLVEIPVEIETPDHHYYHLSFFTTRDVEPLEELTWDYGIDFEDVDHPIKCFQCRCGSQVCRDPNHRTRMKRRQMALNWR